MSTAERARRRARGRSAERARGGSSTSSSALRAFGIVAVLALLVLVTTAIEPRFLDRHEHPASSSATRRSSRCSRSARRWSSSRATSTCRSGSVLGLSAYVSADHVRPPSTASRSPRRCSSSASAIGVACGIVNGVLDGRRPRAEPGGDARDALHHPRHRHPDRRRRSGRRELAAELVHRDLARRRSSAIPDPRDRRSRW